MSESLSAPRFDARVSSALAALEEAISLVQNISDPEEKLRACSLMAKNLKSAGILMAEERTDAMQTLHSMGLSYDQLAECASVSKSRVQQILGKVSRPVRLGKLDYSFGLKAAELRGRGLESLGIAVELVPAIRQSPGGGRLSHKKIASILGCDVKDVILIDQTEVEDTFR